MPLYRCVIRGENFPGKILGEPRPIGFFTTRYVEADTPEEAELRALELLRVDETLRVAPEYRTAAEVFFDTIEAVPDDTPGVPGAGFTFFRGD